MMLKMYQFLQQLDYYILHSLDSNFTSEQEAKIRFVLHNLSGSIEDKVNADCRCSKDI